MPKTNLNLLQRFSKFVKYTSPDECWIWCGSESGGKYGGYGQIKNGGRMCGAHRVSLELFREAPLPGQIVLHSCDNPSCVNPRHLSAGGQSQNMFDMHQKRRHKKRTSSEIRGEK